MRPSVKKKMARSLPPVEPEGDEGTPMTPMATEAMSGLPMGRPALPPPARRGPARNAALVAALRGARR